MNQSNEISELQIKVSYQDKMITDINTVVYKQNEQLAMLIKKVSNLEDVVREIAPSIIKTQAEEMPPPHY